jgi:hypothetical protein
VTVTAPIDDAVDPRRMQRWASAGAGALGAGWIAAAAVTYRPEGQWLGIGCPIQRLTGFDCPGCGSTRSLGALARFDPVAAFDHNVLVPLALVLVAVSWLRWARSAWTGEASPPLVRGPTAILAVGGLLMAFAVVRNLEAAAWLASGLAHSS